MTRFPIAHRLCMTAVLVGALAATAASAQSTVEPLVVTAHRTSDGGETRSTRVSYADLDISTQPGAATLASRITAAAEEVCGGRPAWYDRAAERDEFEQCRSTSMRDAALSVHSFWLSKIVQARTTARP